MLYKVFISYSTKDLLLVNLITKQLRMLEIEVFVSEHSVYPGDSLNNKIMNAIKNFDLFILLWSKNSKISEYVNQEIGIAKGNNKKIIPIVLQKGLNLPAFIKDLKYLSAFKNLTYSINWLKEYIDSQIEMKKQNNKNNLILLGILVLIICLLNK